MIGPPEPGSRERAILRVSPDGSTLESRIPLFFEGPSGSEIDLKVAVGPDGSVYGAVSTAQDVLPVSPGGSRERGSQEFSRDIYFFRVTADGQQLLYATYLGGDENEEVSALVVDREGEVFLGGTTRSQNFPATPGAFRGRVTGGVNLGGFVARWSPAANAFRYVSLFTPQITGLGVALAPAGDGGVVVGSFFASLDATPNAFAPISPDGGFVMRLNPDGTAPVFATGVGDDTRVEAVTVDADGSIAVAGETTGGLATAGALKLPSPYRGLTAFHASIDPTGTRLLYATPLDFWLGRYIADIRTARYVLTDDGETRLTEPVPREAPAGGTFLMALPKVYAACELEWPPLLVWDVRQSGVRHVELRAGTPDGSLLSQSLSGSVPVPRESAVYYLQNVTGGLPLTSAHTLATDRVIVQQPLRCSGVPQAEAPLTAFPNPVLSSISPPGTGTETGLAARWGGEIRVGSPAGPLFAAGTGWVSGATGDWVRNGMEFFLTDSNGKPIASERVYLLPIRDCGSDRKPDPAIRGTRDCRQPNRFTLAWYARTFPVEIREGSQNGPVAGRFHRDTGMFEVQSDITRDYWLMEWDRGEWKSVAATTVYPWQTCEQGRTVP